MTVGRTNCTYLPSFQALSTRDVFVGKPESRQGAGERLWQGVQCARNVREQGYKRGFCFLALACAVLAFAAALDALVAIRSRSDAVRLLALAWPPFWPISRIASRNACRSMGTYYTIPGKVAKGCERVP